MSVQLESRGATEVDSKDRHGVKFPAILQETNFHLLHCLSHNSIEDSSNPWIENRFTESKPSV